MILTAPPLGLYILKTRNQKQNNTKTKIKKPQKTQTSGPLGHVGGNNISVSFLTQLLPYRAKL